MLQLKRQEKWGDYLELTGCVVVSSRVYHLELGDVFDGRKYPRGLTVEISASPDIRIAFT